MKTLWSAVLSLALLGGAFGQANITAGTTTADKNGKSFFVFLPLENSGTTSAQREGDCGNPGHTEIK